MFHSSKPSCTHRHKNSSCQPCCPALCLPSSLLRVTFQPPFFMPQPRKRSQTANLSLWEVSFFNCFQSPSQDRAPGASSVPSAASGASDHLTGVPHSAGTQGEIGPHSRSFQTGDKQLACSGLVTLCASGGDSDSTRFAQQWPCCPWMPRTTQPFRVLGPGAVPPTRCWCQRQSGTSLLRRVRLVKKLLCSSFPTAESQGSNFGKKIT